MSRTIFQLSKGGPLQVGESTGHVSYVARGSQIIRNVYKRWDSIREFPECVVLRWSDGWLEICFDLGFGNKATYNVSLLGCGLLDPTVVDGWLAKEERVMVYVWKGGLGWEVLICAQDDPSRCLNNEVLSHVARREDLPG